MIDERNDHLKAIEECKKAMVNATGIEKAKVYERMGDAYVLMDKETKASICYRYAFEGGLNDARFIDKFADSLSHSGKTDKALALLQTALKQDLTDIEKARLYMRAGHTNRMQADYKESMKNSELALTLLSKSGSRDRETKEIAAEANNIIGLNLWRQAHFDKCLNYFQKSLLLYTELEDDQGISDINNNLGNLAYHRGRFDEAVKYWEEAHQKKERVSYYNNVGLVRMAKGRFDEAEEMYKTCIKMTLRLGRMYVIPIAQLNLADLSMEKGDLVKAKGWIDSAYNSIRELDYTPKMADAMLAKARLAALEGEMASAERYANETLAIARKDKARGIEALTYQILGKTAGAQKEDAKARRSFSKSIEKLRKLGLDYEIGRGLMVHLRFLIAIDDEDEARKVAAEAREVFERLKIDYELGKLQKLGY